MCTYSKDNAYENGRMCTYRSADVEDEGRMCTEEYVVHPCHRCQVLEVVGKPS